VGDDKQDEEQGKFWVQRKLGKGHPNEIRGYYTNEELTRGRKRLEMKRIGGKMTERGGVWRCSTDQGNECPPLQTLRRRRRKGKG